MMNVQPTGTPLAWSDLAAQPWAQLGDQEVPVFVHDEESIAFYEGLLHRSLNQLFSLHSSLELRWEVWHWIFSIPFVSREYGVKPLRAILAAAAERFRDSSLTRRTALDESVCHAVPVKKLGYQEVRFCLAEDFSILPSTCSFEQVCISLGLNPEVLQQRIEEGLRTHGIAELIEQARMGVSAKCASPEMRQQDLIDTDLSDISCFVVPATIRSLYSHRSRSVYRDSDGSAPQIALELF